MGAHLGVRPRTKSSTRPNVFHRLWTEPADGAGGDTPADRPHLAVRLPTHFFATASFAWAIPSFDSPGTVVLSPSQGCRNPRPRPRTWEQGHHRTDFRERQAIRPGAARPGAASFTRCTHPSEVRPRSPRRTTSPRSLSSCPGAASAPPRGNRSTLSGRRALCSQPGCVRSALTWTGARLRPGHWGYWCDRFSDRVRCGPVRAGTQRPPRWEKGSAGVCRRGGVTFEGFALGGRPYCRPDISYLTATRTALVVTPTSVPGLLPRLVPVRNIDVLLIRDRRKSDPRAVRPFWQVVECRDGTDEILMGGAPQHMDYLLTALGADAGALPAGTP